MSCDVPESFAHIYDVKTGIVSHLSELPLLERFPRVYIAAASTGSATNCVGTLSPPPSGAGIGLTRADAVSSAIGEAVERYCGVMAPNQLVSARWADIARGHVGDVETWNQMHAKGAEGFSSLTRGGLTRWCEGHLGREPDTLAYAPWSLAYLGSTPRHRIAQETCFPGPSISTGLACASTWEVAATKAVLECCERDAAMCAWYAGKFPRRLSAAILCELSPFLTSELRRCHLTPLLLDVTAEDVQVPTYVCAIHPQNTRDRAAFGMAAATKPRDAVLKALLEGIHTWIWAAISVKSKAPSFGDDGGFAFPDFETRVLGYGSGLMAANLRPFFEAALDAAEVEPSSAFDAPIERCSRDLCSRLSNLGHEATLVDLTSRDVLDGGLRVARALIPTFQIMESSHALRTMNQARLTRLTGFRARWASRPHPFP